MSRIAVEFIPVKRLDAFARSLLERQGGFGAVPINLARAAAQTLNPVAEEHDPGLALAMHQGRCIGYVGLLPMRAQFRGVAFKMFSGMAQFADPVWRGVLDPERRSLMELIWAEILKLPYDFIVTNYTAAYERFLKRNPQWFKPLAPAVYYALPMRLASVLPESAWMRAAGVGKASARLRVEPAADFEEVSDAPGFTDAAPRLVRDAEVVNWMLHSPWVKPGAPDLKDYYFHQPYRRFEYQVRRWRNDGGAAVGCAVFSLSDRDGYPVVKVLDVRRRPPLEWGDVLAEGVRLARRNRARALVLPAEFGGLIRSSRLLRTLARKCEAGTYLACGSGSPLSGVDEPFRTHYLDGERPFV